jgi:ABC-2 type transport system permease protein
MLSLARREFASFFQSATGVLVLSVYLGLNAVFLWLMPGSFHLLDSGYAQLDGLFMLSPWVFLFLIPALAMRMLAEERRAGTLDWLRAKPSMCLGIPWATSTWAVPRGPTWVF